jgi:DNA-binding PadR family transcriptional regulator
MSLKHSILALLSVEPKTGYQISKDIQGSITFFWKATHQQIYRDLVSLEQSGWVKHREVAQQDKPDKKIYSLTKSGTKELRRWMEEPSEIPATRDGFMIKLFMGHLVDPTVLLEDLRAQKKTHEIRQKHFEEAKENFFQNVTSLPIEDQYKYLTLRRGILLGQAWLAWCEEVEAYLKGQ